MAKSKENEKKYSEVEKLQAAYALNMCTVSVSQIVDFNDKYILDQEYETILNNLNLKNIPKDEALLKILVELLNTITFFRIQDIKKKQIEKKYKEQMKNAIWSAIPNIGVIVASGNPVVMAVSLATQVGSGYMNYRKTKAQNKSAKEDSEIELEIAAIEQFNALRRELFTTAWRLADEYDFDDDFRLTERQIAQYNEILLDLDDIRRYTRLESIKEKFSAYPPFWYYLGHTAALISHIDEIDDDTRDYYIEEAKKHFSHFEKMNEFNILREDYISASFCLEYIDLLLLESDIDYKRIKGLLESAIEKSGNELDLLQLCAITGLKTKDREITKKLFKILINEDYNKNVNAQLLSAIYAQERNYAEHKLLSIRKDIDSRYLFPMPSKDNEDEVALTKEFETKQKELLKKKFEMTLEAVSSFYTERMNRDICYFDLDEEYGNDFFEDSKRGKRLRHVKAERILNDDSKKIAYLERLKSKSLPVIYTITADDMLQNVLEIGVFQDSEIREKSIQKITDAFIENKEIINGCQEKLKNSSFSIKEYDLLQKTDIDAISYNLFKYLYSKAVIAINAAEGTELMSLDGHLFQLCNSLGISVPEVEVEKEVQKSDISVEIPHINTSIFGADAYLDLKENNRLDEMAEFVKNCLGRVKFSDKVSVVYKSDVDFSNYFNNGVFYGFTYLQSQSVAIIKNINEKYDFIFTIDGIVYLRKGSLKEYNKIPYGEVSVHKDKLNMYGKKLKTSDVDINALYSVIKNINEKYITNKKPEIINNINNIKDINSWFLGFECSSMPGIKGVYAIPNETILESMDLHIDLDTSSFSNYLLQFLYEEKEKLVLEYRIIEFEEINPQFKKVLDEGKGIIAFTLKEEN